MLAKIGTDCIINDNVTLSFKYIPECKETSIGSHAIIRSGSIIYADVTIGDNLITGHNILIREKTTIGNTVVIGSNTIIEGNVKIGDFVKIESNVYIPTHTIIGNNVFIGPGATMTNDKYPQRMRDAYTPVGPVIEDGVTIGANSTILPGVRIGKGAIVGAGSVVTKDVPPWNFAIGVPAIFKPLPEKLQEMNRAKSQR